MYCKLAVEAKLHFHINSDVMNSIVLITRSSSSSSSFFFFSRVGRAARTPGEPTQIENRI